MRVRRNRSAFALVLIAALVVAGGAQAGSGDGARVASEAVGPGDGGVSAGSAYGGAEAGGGDGGAVPAEATGGSDSGAATAVAHGAAGVTDRLTLGSPSSEARHDLSADGPSGVARDTAVAGRIEERYEARWVADGGALSATLRIRPHNPLTLQLREVRPNPAWGAAYGYRVYLNDTLVHVRDNATADPGGGPYSSVFVETRDPAIVGRGHVRIRIEGTSAERAYFTDVWAYADLDRMVEQEGMQATKWIVPLIGQDYTPQQRVEDNLAFIRANLHERDGIRLGAAVLDYFPVRSPEQLAANYDRLLGLAKAYRIPLGLEGTSDWEGTPKGVPDGRGGVFGDIEYQQILWSEQDQTADVWNNRRLADFLGDNDLRWGLSVPNIWGNTPWLTWNHPHLNAFYTRKANESLSVFTPRYYDLQRQGLADLILPFSTTTESVYWAKQDGEGVWDIVYQQHNGGVERRTLLADFNPTTVAAAAEDGVRLNPKDGLDDAEKWWLYQNTAEHQQMFADIYYHGLPRRRIEASPSGLTFPSDLLKHNVFSEVYSRREAPYWSSVFPTLTQGFVRRARPGSEYISLDDHTANGFGHLIKSRELGRLANPNLENSVSPDWRDKLLLLRRQYVTGSRYTTIYNWSRDDVANWVNGLVDDPHPWDVTAEGEAAEPTRARTIGQSFTAGDVRMTNRIDVRLEPGAGPARLTLYDSPEKRRVLAMRHLGAAEVAAGWTAFRLPIAELEEGRVHYLELEYAGRADTLAGGAHAGGALYEDGVQDAGRDLAFRVGLDMPHERNRSLVIQWRRDAADAIANVAAQTTGEDRESAQLLARARRALAEERTVEAYRLAIRADALRYPVPFQVHDAGRLDPFPLHVAAAGAVDVDVESDSPLRWRFMSYDGGRVTFTVRAPGRRPEVLVDGEPWPSRRHGPNVTFSVDVAAREQRTVRVVSGR